MIQGRPPLCGTPDNLFRDLVFSPVDMYEEAGELVVQADLPGFRKEDINIYLDNDTLFVEAVSRDVQTSTRDYHRRERRPRHFRESIALPAEVDRNLVFAKLQDGVLEVRLRKTGPPREVAVVPIK